MPRNVPTGTVPPRFADALLGIELKAEAAVVSTGGFVGAVRPPQRKWSRTLDAVNAVRGASP